jgi:hypothetical protein
MVALQPTWTREARADGVTSVSSTVRVAFSADVASQGGVASVNVLGRRIGTDNYAARVRLEPNGVIRLYLLQNQNLLGQYLVPFSYEPGMTLVAQFGVTGTSPTTLAAKVWRADTSEPSAWQVSASSSTPSLQAPGSPSLLLAVSSASTVPLTRVVLDGFRVTTGN